LWACSCGCSFLTCVVGIIYFPNMCTIYAQLAQLVSTSFNSYRKVPSSTPTGAFVSNCIFLMLYYVREVVPQSLWSLWRVHRESSWSPHGIHCISDSLSRLYGESMKTPHGLHMDSTQSPCRLLGTSRKWTMESLWSPHRVHEESLRSPQRLLRVFMESMETCG
jgi:hypothetical protein